MNTQQTQGSVEITDVQKAELLRLKAYYPFRIVFGVVDKDTHEFSAYCKTTMHTANKLAREGHAVFLVK